MAEGPTISLPARQLFEIPDAAGVRILCTAGCLWLTLDNDPNDVILEPGQTFEGREPRRALLYAMDASTFSLCAAPRRTMRRGLASSTAGRSPSLVVWGVTRAASSG